MYYSSSDELCCEETLLAFDIFKECISTTLNLFKRKFEVLINKMPENGDENFDKNVLRIVNQLTGMILKLCDSTKNKEFNEKSKETKLLAVNMSVIDMFVPYVDAGTPFCAQVKKIFGLYMDLIKKLYFLIFFRCMTSFMSSIQNLQ